MLALSAVAASGCDQVKGLVGRFTTRGQSPADTTAAVTPPAAAGGDTAQAPAGPAGGRATPPRSAPPPPVAILRDEPYASEDTGTVAPGMSEREVYALWGPPAAVRRAGDMVYLYFKNGCEYTCGTMDVVFLQHDAVIDAIVRWPGHGYSGQSSSPPGVKPVPTRGGDTLTIPTTPSP
jgi:hypothetical protein